MTHENTSALLGLKFGKLTITNVCEINSGVKKVECQCECGNIKEFILANIKRGNTISCGCFKGNKGLHLKTHGLTKHPLYKIWAGLKRRCYNINEKSYPDYGGRGIIVCDEWLDNPSAFIAWGLANGYKKGLEIDREKNDGNYTPENCRFVTSLVNSRNSRRGKFIEYLGETKCLSEWAEILGLNAKRVGWRLASGWTVKDAFERPYWSKYGHAAKLIL